MKAKVLPEELNQIDKKIGLKKTKIKNSPRYLLLKKIESKLEGEKWDIERELRKLKKEIYIKYINNPIVTWSGSFETKNTKSSVKQGIKRGLGIKNVYLINKYDLRHILLQIIDKDLKKIKTQTDKLESKIVDKDIKLKKIKDKKDKLMEGLNPLTKQREKIDRRINKEKYLKEKRIVEARSEIKRKISNLPKFIDKIIKEVNKSLMLENLK